MGKSSDNRYSWYIKTSIASAVVMMIASFIWHGVILNDLSKVNYSPVLFYFLAFIVYLFFGCVNTAVAFKVNIFSKRYITGTFGGGVFGFVVYLIAFVLGVSFANQSAMEHVAIDFVWQMIEQGAGGFIAGGLASFYKTTAMLDAN